jgi:hypothetical protein
MQLWIYVLVVLVYWRAMRLRRKIRGDPDYLCPAIGGLLVCYLVGGFTFDYRYFETLNTLFYFFAGVLSAWVAGGYASVRSLGVRAMQSPSWPATGAR